MNASPLILLLGSNQGNSRALLRKAIDLLQFRIGKIETASSVYSTKAWGETDQPDFLNQVVVIPYTGTAIQALEIVLNIEHEMGRVRSKKWGVRIIDIDLLYFGDKIHHTTTLTLPHAALHLRRFTLVPLVEILPDFVHPVFSKTQKQLLDACADQLDVLKLV
ncbi:MAG: 2-amino-4-hydroxy-6-hydroxymethyldihydropteridine diphosphokinase [Cytophagales bacterium]|nr:2-amino-4-hydroxy-6-hydroxymethyldihydropteridine diphosphokinase [Cytophagales bacterium]